MIAVSEHKPPSSVPLVSLLIPVFNRAPFVTRAIASATAQTQRDLEIIAWDDGSTDASHDILSELARSDPRIALGRSARHEGVAVARNHLLARARGQYVCFLDADDFIAPEKVAAQLAFLDANPAVCAVGTGCHLVDAKERILKRVRYTGNPGELRYFPDICCASVMYRAEVLSRAGAFRTDLTNGADVDFVLRIAEFGQVTNLPEALYFYRQHPGQLSRRGGNGHIIAVAFKLYRSLGWDGLIEGRALSEAEIFRRVLKDAGGMLGAGLPREAGPAVVLLLMHAARRWGRWHDVARILALCATKMPWALLRVSGTWLGAAYLKAKYSSRLGTRPTQEGRTSSVSRLR
jgi:glycosyltransferase involved in cell wall biosynthesis